MGLHHCIQLCTGSVPAAAAGPSDDDGMMSTQLYLAVCEGRSDQTVPLLAAHQIAGITSAERNNVLHLAAEQGHVELIRELYDRFGDKNLLSSRNSALDTPLHCAARAGHDKAVSLLVQLSRGCGEEETALWCKNEAGDTALHLAARLGHGDAVKVMVTAVPELASEVNEAGVSPLYLAVMSRSVPAVEAITTSCHDASAAGPSSQNALHAAVFQSKRMVGLLLEWKPSLASEADGSGSTPLHFASSDGDRSVVGAILSAAPPCAVRMRDSAGLSALHIAAGMGHSRVVEALMVACPDAAELRDDRGGTFLHAAARGGHLNVVSLVTGSSKPTLRRLLNVQDGEGNTPLHLVVAAGAPDVAEALMRKGKVRADVMNNDGQTPLDLAATSTSFFSMLGLVVTLAAFGAQSRPQRRDRVEQGSHDVAKGIEKTSDSLAVVAVLIATVAFTAANNVPGSYQDDGMAVLQRKTIFKYFLVLDSFALVTSVIAVVLLIFGKASRSAGSWKTFAVALHCIWLSLIAIILAFYAALAAVTNTRAVYRVAYHVIYVGFSLLYIVVNVMIAPPVSTRTVCKVLWRTLFGKHSVVGRRIKQQYPVAGAYAPNLLLFWATNGLAITAFVAVSILSQRPAI